MAMNFCQRSTGGVSRAAVGIRVKHMGSHGNVQHRSVLPAYSDRSLIGLLDEVPRICAALVSKTVLR